MQAGHVEAANMLRALDDPAHQQAARQVHLLVCAEAVGGEEAVILQAVERPAEAAVIETDHVLPVDVVGCAGFDPLAHDGPPEAASWFRLARLASSGDRHRPGHPVGERSGPPLSPACPGAAWHARGRRRLQHRRRQPRGGACDRGSRAKRRAIDLMLDRLNLLAVQDAAGEIAFTLHTRENSRSLPSGTGSGAGQDRKPEAMLTVTAMITVLNTKPRKPCMVATRRSLRDVICTSETWNVIPSTTEK